jgi:hypothetical protein
MLLQTVHIHLKTQTPDFRISTFLFEGPQDSLTSSSDNSSLKMKTKISVTEMYLNYINSLRNSWGTNSFSSKKINQSVLIRGDKNRCPMLGRCESCVLKYSSRWHWASKGFGFLSESRTLR